MEGRREEDIMDARTVEDVINDATARILAINGSKPTDIAKLVKILHDVHTDGYGHGLHQGHVDAENLPG
jgi:hypothetical protein